jgi:hypothetical protein
MRGYYIVLFIIVFTAVGGAVNALGIFGGTEIPVTSYSGLDQATVNEIVDGAAAAEWNPLGGLSSIGTIFGTLGSGLASLIDIVPMMVNMGLNPVLAGMIAAPILFVAIWSIANWLGNRQQNN